MMSLAQVVGAVGILLTCGLLAVELVLRYWAKRELFSTRSTRNTFAFHEIEGSWVLPHEIAKLRDPEFSPTQWREMEEWDRTRTIKHLQSGPGLPVLNQISGPDYVGKESCIRDGERRVLNQPERFLNEVLCLGGSTTFCREVADGNTWPSILQRRVNEVDIGRTQRVRNLGIPGTPGLERINTFVHATKIHGGDTAIFLFGDNDSGWVQYGEREGVYSYHLPIILRRLVGYGEVLELAGWLYGELAPRYLRRLAVEMAETTIAAAEDAAKFAQSRGANVLFVLQPNIFTLARPDDWDCRIIAGTARDLPIMLAAAYERYREWTADSPIAVDATHLFDSESPSPYMGDWSHVNTRGNRLIGEFVFDQLKTRGLLAPTANLG